MRNIFPFLLMIISYNVMAIDAVVIAHRAPMFKNPDVDSIVYQYVNKGEIVFINNKHIDRTYLTNYHADEDIGKNLIEDTKFYATTDRIGRPAFILKRHIKIIFGDTRETDTPVSLGENDETDYRIKGKLPKNYPFIRKEKNYSTFMIGTETVSKNSYPYPLKVIDANYGQKYKISGITSWKASFDRLDRIYFGIKGELGYLQNKYFLENELGANEFSFIWTLGPHLSYDFYKTDSIMLRLSGGILVNYQLMKITQISSDGFRDDQYYSGIYLSPEIGLSLLFRDVLKDTDFVVASNARANLPYSLGTAMTKYEESRWNIKDDRVKYPFAVNADLTCGLSYKY